MSPTVDIRLDAGAVEIIAEPRDVPTATIEAYDDSDPSHVTAANTRIELRGDTLYVHAPKNHRLLGHSARLRITVRTPPDSQLRATVASADITCRGQLADVVFKSASGDLSLEQVSGSVTFKTGSGNLQAIRLDGDLRAGTASGQIHARQVRGAVRARTTSGEVEIEETGAGVRVDTVSAEVRLAAPRRGTVRVGTVSGAVSVGVPAGTGVWLDLTTTAGTAHSDLKISDDPPPSGHDLTLSVRTVSGDIEVRRIPLPAPAG